MNLNFFLFAFNRKTERLETKTELDWHDDDIRRVLGLPSKANLVGDFAIDVDIAKQLRKLGVALDLRTSTYFLGSEASNEDVEAAIEALKVPSKRLAKPSSKKTMGAKKTVTTVPRWAGVPVGLLPKSGSGGRIHAVAKKAPAKKAAAKRPAAKKAAAKKAP